MTIQHPSNPNLVFEAEYFPLEQETGEHNYSLGDPPIQARYEITAVAWQGNDITEFVLDFCDKLLPEWEEELLD